jgi:nucleotide-binding universal stress UspA family protein
MFKHILLPIDGSALANKALRKGVDLAKSINAKVTCVFVALPYRLVFYEGYQIAQAQKLMQARYEKEVRQYARELLGKAEHMAAQAGVSCNSVHASALAPYRGIIRTARRGGCDLIVMASHGHGGVAALLLGSVTNKVLTHSRIPVLVYR